MALASRRKTSPVLWALEHIKQFILACVLVLVSLLLPATMPSDDARVLPGVTERFTDLIQSRTQSAIKPLPGVTLQEFQAQTQASQEAQATQSLAQQGAQSATAPPRPVVVAPTAAPEERYPRYEPGSLQYQSDTLQISIEQYEEGKITYFVADIQIKDASQFGYAFSSDKFKSAYESVSDIADRNGAILAINSDFCGFHNEGVIIRGGELFRKQNSKRHLLIVDKNGNMSALVDRREKQGQVAERLMSSGNTLHTFEFGPLLVKDGEPFTLPRSFFVRTPDDYKEPRTAIGQIGPMHYIVIVVDGRQTGYSEGVSLSGLQRLFLKHDAKFAFNLDGGGSTTLYFEGKVINHPSSGDERRVSDIIMFNN
jgi:exopolysaccharide biosynthesis protein